MSAPPADAVSLAVVILAAGASSRMGWPKLLLPWGSTSVLGHLVGQWRSLGARQVAVVVAADNHSLDVELDRLEIVAADRIPNPRPGDGMFSSVQCAARWGGWAPTLTHFAITLGDQPQVGLETLRQLLDFCGANFDKVCQPSRNGRGRHPVILPATVFQELRVAAEPNLKEFLANRSGSRTLCEMDDAGLDFDLDEPADYERALRLMSAERTCR